MASARRPARLGCTTGNSVPTTKSTWNLTKITHVNHSPDVLEYLWLQLDPNLFAPDSAAALSATAPKLDKLPYDRLRSLIARETFDGSVKITSVVDSFNQPIRHVVVGTMMRLDLPQALKSGESFVFSVAWNYQINDSKEVWGRTGYEYFEEDGNYIYEIAQWFPRMVSYTDVTGWQHSQFIGRGEFTLELGNYLLRITLPADHVVAASGVLLNPDELLTDQQ